MIKALDLLSFKAWGAAERGGSAETREQTTKKPVIIEVTELDELNELVEIGERGFFVNVRVQQYYIVQLIHLPVVLEVVLVRFLSFITIVDRTQTDSVHHRTSLLRR